MTDNPGNERLQEVTKEANSHNWLPRATDPVNRCPSTNNGYKCMRKYAHVDNHIAYDKDHDVYVHWSPPVIHVMDGLTRIREGIPPF